MVRAAGQDGRARRGNIRCRPSWLSELLKQELRSREGRQQSAIEEEWELDSKALPTQPGRGATAALPNLKPKLTSACAGDIDSSSDCLGARGSGQWMVVSGQTFTSCHPDPERGRGSAVFRQKCRFPAALGTTTLKAGVLGVPDSRLPTTLSRRALRPLRLKAFPAAAAETESHRESCASR